MSSITFRYNQNHLKSFLINNLFDLILLFNVFPIFFLLGIPHPKLILISLIIPFLFFKKTRELIFNKFDNFLLLIIIFIIYQVFTLIYSFFYYDLSYFNNGQIFYNTIFVYSIYSFFPLLIAFLVKSSNLKKLKKIEFLAIFLYTFLGIFILSSIVYKFKFFGLEFDFTKARDILTLGINGVPVTSGPNPDTGEGPGIPEGRFSLSTIYYYFGRSNTLAPSLSLIVLTILPYFRKLSAGLFNKKNIFLSLLLFINIFVIFVLRSRASLIAITLAFLGLEIIFFLGDKNYFSKIFRGVYLILISSTAFLFVALSSTRYSLNAFFNSSRFDILVGIFSNLDNISFFGKGIGSTYFLCSTLGMEYIEVYNTTECTLHNYYLTLLHDFGYLGFSIFILIVFFYIRNLFLGFKIFLKSSKLNKRQIISFPYQILSSIYFILGSLLLLFFDSDILTIQTTFSVLYWSLFVINFYSIEYYINEFEK